jgi:hypothetical protein
MEVLYIYIRQDRILHPHNNSLSSSMIGHTLEKFVGIASVGKVQTKKGN